MQISLKYSQHEVMYIVLCIVYLVALFRTIHTEFIQANGQYTLPAKSLEYSENTMETLAFDILIYCEWLGINHK